MSYSTLPSDTVRNALLSTKGKAFYIEFIKRTDGTYRRLIGRLGVRPQKPAQIEKRKGEDLNSNCLTVWEFGRGYKRIPLDRVIRLSANKERM